MFSNHLIRHIRTVSRRYPLIGVVVAVLSQSGLLHAEQVTGLYEVELPVSSQDREERTKALQQAFSEVLVRVSGRADLVQSTEYPNIQAAIQSATRFAQQYRYRKVANRHSSGDTLNLWVRFDEAALTRLLRANNLPVWGMTRPETLVWLAVDERGKRELVGNNSKHPALRILKEQAQRRGVPLRMPLLDLTDRTGLRVSDVWGNFESPILRASQRYQTEAVLVGRVFQQYRGWTARWSLYADNRRRDWTLTGDTLQEVLAPGIDTTAESLAQRYTQVAGVNDGSILVEVRDIKSLTDFNRVQKYLHTLSSVTAVQPYRIVDNAAVFELSTPAGRMGVARAVALGHTLVTAPTETAPVETASNPDLVTKENTAILAANQHQVTPDLIYRLVP